MSDDVRDDVATFVPDDPDGAVPCENGERPTPEEPYSEAAELPSIQQMAAARTAVRYLRLIALAIASLYVFLAGIWNDPRGVQESLLMLAMLGALRYSCSLERAPSRAETAVYVLGLVNSVWPAVTTNAYMVGLNELVFVVTASVLFVISVEGLAFPMSAGTWASGFARATGHTLLSFFDPRLGRAFMPAAPRVLGYQIDQRRVVTTLMTLCLLTIFHFLFAEVNGEYAAFMDWWLTKLFDLLRYILNIRFIVDCVYATLLGYLLFVVLCGRTERRCRTYRRTLRDTVATLVGASAILFLVFIRFQSKLLFISPSAMPFKELSLYVQKGFWELLLVAIIGYVLIAISLRQRPVAEESGPRWRNLLCAFCLELLLVTIFCAHKLAVLQTYFGLKDHRVLASTAVLLIGVTFFMVLARILRGFAPESMFAAQTYLLATSVIVLSAANLDLVVTRVSPTSYYIDEQRYSDYAYLLMNSYDNSSEWLALAAEARSTGIPMPANYYWGQYHSLCGERRGPSLRSHWRSVTQKFETAHRTGSVRQLTALTLNEWRAYQVLAEHPREFHQFADFVESECARAVEARQQ